MKNKGKMRILALVLCMVVMLSNSSFIFASGETETAAVAPETTAVTPEPEVSAASELAELPTPEPTAEPTEAPTPEPTAEPTPEASAAPEPTEVPMPEVSAAPEPTAEPTPEASAAPEPTEVPTPEASAVPEPTAEPTPEASATPEPTEVPTPEASASPTPAAEQDIGSEESAAVTPTPEAEPEPDGSSEEIVLEGSCGDTTVILSGPASSFPEGTELSILVQEPAEEDQEVIEEAVEKQAEDQEMEVKSYTALDIRLLSNGEEIQPLGPVSVKFQQPEQQERTAEETSTQVLHVDESTGDATDMEAEVTEDGEVAIETTHFSIYVVVDLNRLGGEITVKVEHYAVNIKSLKGTGDKPQGTKEGLKDYGNGNWGPDYDLLTDETKIYTDDEIKLYNGNRTTIESLSKICAANGNNYELKKIRIDGQEYNVNSDPAQTITLTKDSTICMIYEPKSSGDNVTLKTPTLFFDYDVTNDEWKTAYLGGDKTAESYYGIITDRRGINSENNFKGGVDGENNRLKFGFRSNGFFHSERPTETEYAGSYLNEVNGNGFEVRKRIVQDRLDANGDLQLSSGIFSANLFSNGSAEGKHTYENYELGFIQEGDTYTLSQVYRGNESVLGNLQNIRNITQSVYANNFWPLDCEKNKDPLFGDSKGAEWYGLAVLGDGSFFANTNIVQNNKSAIGYSDDKVAHNWYFGMEYEFTFTLGDYVGPLNFYFRGDDDFWLYVDGELKMDLGGIHSSVGQYLDLSYLRQEPDKEHTIKIYYLERGGYGSSCYIQFTLPNVQPVVFEPTETTTATVNKVWEDYNNPNRPDSIEVTLQYKKEGESVYTDYQTVSLSMGNNWSYTWSGIPKTGYTYKVVEKNVPDGYKVEYKNGDGSGGILQSSGGAYTGTITNKANPSTWINVEKKWQDNAEEASETRPDSIKVQLYYKYKENDKWMIYPGGLMELNEANQWKGKYDNLPVVYQEGNSTSSKILYTVVEVDDNKILKPGDILAGKNNTKYTVSYPEGHYTNGNWSPYIAEENAETLNLTITNSLGREVEVQKEWKGTLNDSIPESIYVGLYLDGKAVKDKWIALTATNHWSGKFEYLGAEGEYTVKELRATNDDETIGDFEINGQTYVGINAEDKVTIGGVSYDVTYAQGTATNNTATNNKTTYTITNQGSWQIIKKSKSGLPLGGAVFTLTKGDSNPVYTGTSAETTGLVTWKDANGADVDDIATITDGTYTLTEKTAPTGYQPGGTWEITITNGVPTFIEKTNSDGFTDKNDKGVYVNGVLTFYYVNEALYALPDSGGTGIYGYVLGGMLFMTAAMLMLYKQRLGGGAGRKRR